MSEINCARRGCKDVFHAFLVKNAVFDGELEIPCIQTEDKLPSKLIPFSKAVGGNNYSAWVHFYEDDAVFERLWTRPERYLPILKRYEGIIAPDFSIVKQTHVQTNGSTLIPADISVKLERAETRTCEILSQMTLWQIPRFFMIRLLVEG